MLKDKSPHIFGALILAIAIVSCSRTPESPSAAAATADADSAASVAAAPPAPAEDAPADHSHDLTPAGPHADHDSKHGGTFFMALDNRHHLEGVLHAPGVFRVYLYDEYTQPLNRSELEHTEATVIWGDQDGAPQIELKPSADGTVLEAKAPGPVRFPVTLTLLVRFPGMAADARRELFTFPFSHYSHIDTKPHTHSTGG